MSLIKRLIGLVGLFGVVALSMGNIVTFINWPSLFIVIGLTACALLFSDAKIHTADFWHQARVYAMGSGLVGFLIGAVIMLSNMESSSITGMGSGMAISTLTILYAAFFGYFIALPLEHKQREE